MFPRHTLRSWFWFPLVLATTQLAFSQITVEGINDRQVYPDNASFRVVTLVGYDFEAFLDDQPVPVGEWVDVTKVDYHELFVRRTQQGTGTETTRLLPFIVRSTERGNSEWGLPAWVPYPPIPSAPAELAGAHLRIIAPKAYPAGMDLPVVVWVENAEGGPVRVNGWLNAAGHPSIRILRGAGSGYMEASTPAGIVEYNAELAGVRTNLQFNLEATPSWETVLPGTLNGETVWPENSRKQVLGDLTIPAGSTLTIGRGTIVQMRNLADFYVNGHVIINGTVEEPVVFAHAARNQPWGGFFLPASTSRLDATGAIFAGACALQSGFAGHKNQQCLFYVGEQSGPAQLNLTDCAAIDLRGQFGHGFDRTDVVGNYHQIRITRTLAQRMITGGEWNGCDIEIQGSAFLNCVIDSAFFTVEPVTPIFQDEDEDGIYFTSGRYVVRDSLFGWNRDDSIDAGSEDGGWVSVSNVWVESTFHEAFAWSGGGGPEGPRVLTNLHCVALNNGQGYECGWTREGGVTPDVHVRDCLGIGNLTGARFGDNYDWTYNGFLRVYESILLHNYRDVWGLNWQPDRNWAYRDGQMDIQDNYLTAPNPHHPDNQIWDPSADAARLASFMTTPPEAPVGIGLAIWREQFDLNEVSNGIPVGLSCFTTNVVTVDYAAQTSSGATLAQGTLTIEPGWTLKPLQLDIPNVQEQGMIRVSLSNPGHGELTGIRHCYLVRKPQAPSGAETTLIPRRSDWKYHNLNTSLPVTWRGQGYDDSGWPGSGPGPLGNNVNSGVQQCTTVINIGPSGSRYPTIYFRRTFEVADPSAFGTLRIGLQRDDGGVVYINGQEVYRDSNVPVGQTHTTWTSGDTPSESEYASQEASASMLQAGANVIAAEIHQGDAGSSDLTFDLELFGAPGTETPIYVGMFDGEVVLGWGDPAYQLEEAPAVTGPWSPSTAPSPVVVDPSLPQRFYRLSRP